MTKKLKRNRGENDMKKFISLMICVAMILSSVGAMADSDSLIVNTVKVNVSSGSVTLNDEKMSV